MSEPSGPCGIAGRTDLTDVALDVNCESRWFAADLQGATNVPRFCRCLNHAKYKICADEGRQILLDLDRVSDFLD